MTPNILNAPTVQDHTSVGMAERWQDCAASRRIASALDVPLDTAAEALAARAGALLADDGLMQPLLAPLIAALRADPWFEPPVKVSRDAQRIGAILFDCPAASLSATISSAPVAAAAHPASIVVSGRLTVVRYQSAGGAHLRRWDAGKATDTLSAATAPPCVALPPLDLADGMVLVHDGRRHAHFVGGARSPVVTLTVAIRLDPAPFMREYRIADGQLIRIGMLDDRGARTDMLLTLLRHADRADAGDCFEAATHARLFFHRWSAMREWLALDLGAALPRLRAMADGDPHPEIRAAAQATLLTAEARLRDHQAASCPA